MKCIIVEDEPLSVNLLKNVLAEKFPEVEVLATFDKISEASNYLNGNTVDFIFLDIQLNGELGIELFKYIPKEKINFDIIFTTTYGGFALEAFEMSAIDYLLKPLDIKRLEESVFRVKSKRNISVENLDVFNEIASKGIIQRIILPMQGKKIILNTEEIQYLKADNVYTEIYTEDAMYIVSKPLKSYEPLLGLGYFYKTHRSFIVNINYVKSLQLTSQDIEMKNGDKIRISKEKVSEFNTKLNNIA